MNFVELVQQMYSERFQTVLGKIVQEKIPVAFLAMDPKEVAMEFIAIFRKNGFNITTLITPPLLHLTAEQFLAH